MINAKLKILSQGRDWKQKIDVPCTVIQTAQGHEIAYQTEGDSCVLTVTPQAAYMVRTGVAPLRLAFYLGRKAQCIIGLPEGEGIIQSTTYEYVYAPTPNGISVKLVYDLDGAEKITLRATAFYQTKSTT